MKLKYHNTRNFQTLLLHNVDVPRPCVVVPETLCADHVNTTGVAHCLDVIPTRRNLNVTATAFNEVGPGRTTSII